MNCRSYYRCTHSGCNAKKQVQQKSTSAAGYPLEYGVVFTDEHTCSTTTGLSITQLRLLSPAKGKQISFEKNEPSPGIKDDGAHSLLSVETASLITPEFDLGDDLALIPPMSPEGYFYGYDASAHYGLEETFDPYVAYY